MYSLPLKLPLTLVQVQAEEPPGGQLWRTYYYAGGQRIAVRERAATTDELTYLHPSRLRAGSFGYAQGRLRPFRATLGTGYHARYYDPTLGRGLPNGSKRSGAVGSAAQRDPVPVL